MTKSKEKNKSKGFNTFLFIFIFSFSIFLLLAGFIYLLTGYHNFDVGNNLKYINAVSGTDFVDYYTVNNYYTNNEQIIKGVDQLQTGLYFTVAGAILVGYYLCCTAVLTYNELNKK